jgi:hypothetical protein
MASTSEALLAQIRKIDDQLEAMKARTPEAEALTREAERLHKEYEALIALVLDGRSPEEFAEPRMPRC